jgi:copper chaperone CopZ
MAQVTFTVLFIPDITCGHCERAVTRVLLPVEGVQRVVVDVSTYRARVDYDPARVDVARMTAILAEAGYPIAGIATADDQPETTE